MDTMDPKGIAWVGNIYQKFEAMCLEVEETMCQETAKYVEYQVQTMGTSMKRFYSDVMQDLLPPSSIDPTKISAADLLLNPYADLLLTPYTDIGIHKKPKACIKDDAKKHVCIKGVSEKDNFLPSEKSSSRAVMRDLSTASPIGEFCGKDEAACDQIAMISPEASVEVVRCNCREEAGGKTCNCTLDIAISISDAISVPTSSAVVLVESTTNKGKKLRNISASSNLTETSRDKCRDSGLVSQTGSYPSDDLQSGQSADEEVFVFNTGRSNNCNFDMLQIDDTTEPRMETIEEDSNSKLEETCVLVDGDDFCPLACKESKNRSYKKKIREALFLKKKSARKQEYKQLAAQCGNVDTQSNPKYLEAAMPIIGKNSYSKKSPTDDFSESEWELL